MTRRSHRIGTKLFLPLLGMVLSACAGQVGQGDVPDNATPGAGGEQPQGGQGAPDAGQGSPAPGQDSPDAGDRGSGGTDAPDPGRPRESAGCGLDPPFLGGPAPQTLPVPATEEDRETATITREYYLYVPESYDSEQPYQLLFSYHSCNGTGETGFPVEVEQASGESTIIVSPTGLTPSTRCDGNGWSSPSDLPFFDALYDEITQRYCIDLGRVFSTGYSYGGEMTNQLNCKRGNLLAGTASRSGGLAGESGCTPELPATFLAHVEGDTSPAPFSASETLIKTRVADRGCDGEDAFSLDDGGCRVYAGCSSPVTYCRCTAPIDRCGLPSAGIENPHGVTNAREWREAAWDFLRRLP